MHMSVFSLLLLALGSTYSFAAPINEHDAYRALPPLAEPKPRLVAPKKKPFQPRHYGLHTSNVEQDFVVGQCTTDHETYHRISHRGGPSSETPTPSDYHYISPGSTTTPVPGFGGRYVDGQCSANKAAYPVNRFSRRGHLPPGTPTLPTLVQWQTAVMPPEWLPADFSIETVPNPVSATSDAGQSAPAADTTVWPTIAASGGAESTGNTDKGGVLTLTVTASAVVATVWQTVTAEASVPLPPISVVGVTSIVTVVETVVDQTVTVVAGLAPRPAPPTASLGFLSIPASGTLA